MMSLAKDFYETYLLRKMAAHKTSIQWSHADPFQEPSRNLGSIPGFDGVPPGQKRGKVGGSSTSHTENSVRDASVTYKTIRGGIGGGLNLREKGSDLWRQKDTLRGSPQPTRRSALLHFIFCHIKMVNRRLLALGGLYLPP